MKLIDWNVTARTTTPFVKNFEEERELTVYLMVDISASGEFGSGSQLKRELGTEIAAVLGFSAIKNNDKVGLILFSDSVEKFIFPKREKPCFKGDKELLYTDQKILELQLVIHLLFIKGCEKKSVVFIISDFLDSGYNSSLKIVSKT